MFILFFFLLKETTGINSLMEAILNFCPPDGWCRTTRRIKEMKREMSSRGKKKKRWLEKEDEGKRKRQVFQIITWLKERALSCALHFRFAPVLLPSRFSLSLSLSYVYREKCRQGGPPESHQLSLTHDFFLADQLSIILRIHGKEKESYKQS